MSEPGHTLTEAEAKRFYDRYGRKLDLGEPFEGRAKERARDLAALRPGERVLEVGVGCGHFLAFARSRVGDGGLVVGVDLSETMLSLGRERAPGAALVRGSILRLPLGESFDVVCSNFLLDLLPGADLDQALGELARVTRPGGRVVLCGLTPGRTFVERCVMGLWSTIHALSPVRVGGCRPLELTPRLARAGLELVQHEHVGQLGVASEVLVTRRRG